MQSSALVLTTKFSNTKRKCIKKHKKAIPLTNKMTLGKKHHSKMHRKLKTNLNVLVQV